MASRAEVQSARDERNPLHMCVIAFAVSRLVAGTLGRCKDREVPPQHASPPRVGEQATAAEVELASEQLRAKYLKFIEDRRFDLGVLVSAGWLYFAASGASGGGVGGAAPAVNQVLSPHPPPPPHQTGPPSRDAGNIWGAIACILSGAASAHRCRHCQSPGRLLVRWGVGSFEGWVTVLA
jgi:hypothetical protein